MPDEKADFVSFDIADDPPRDTKTDNIIIAVTIFGALIAVPAILALLGSFNLSLGGGTGRSSIAGLFDFAYLALGVGLIFRRELARQIFVVLAVISLILIVVGGLADLADGGALGRLLPGFLLTLIPLIYLSRPAVKKVFS